MSGFVPALVLFAPIVNAQPARAVRIDSARLLGHAEVLAHDSMGGRSVGSAGNESARAYLVRQFEQLGLEKLRGRYTQGFALSAQRDVRNAASEGANVLGLIRGYESPGRYIVMSAHYDHLPPRGREIFNGADDNASGTAALLELARYFSRNAPRNSIIFVAMDAEERGLLGAKAFLNDPPVSRDSIVMNVNTDMIGRNDRGELYATGTMHYPVLKPLIARAQSRARVKLLMGHDEAAPGHPPSDNWTNSSDHGPFHEARIPFIYFGVEDHDDYHRPTDDFSRLQPSFFARAAETILDAVLIFDANLTDVARARNAGSLEAERDDESADLRQAERYIWPKAPAPLSADAGHLEGRY